MVKQILGSNVSFGNGKRKRAAIWIGRVHAGKDSHTEAHEQLGIPVFKCGDTLKQMAAVDPRNPMFEPIRRRTLVDSRLVNWAVKVWVIRNLGEPIIHLNGFPRKTDQLPIIEFLKARGFDPMVIWFTTPEEECVRRPTRPGRELEDSPEKRAQAMKVYAEETEPMRHSMEKVFGIRPENGNMLLIDNTNLTKHQTCASILEFLGLPFESHQLFPAAEEGSEKLVRAKAGRRTKSVPPLVQVLA